MARSGGSSAELVLRPALDVRSVEVAARDLAWAGGGVGRRSASCGGWRDGAAYAMRPPDPHPPRRRCGVRADELAGSPCPRRQPSSWSGWVPSLPTDGPRGLPRRLPGRGPRRLSQLPVAARRGWTGDLDGGLTSSLPSACTSAVSRRVAGAMDRRRPARLPSLTRSLIARAFPEPVPDDRDAMRRFRTR